MNNSDIKEIANALDFGEPAAGDRMVRSITKLMDEDIEKSIANIKHTPEPPDDDGEETCAAMPVSDALKAVHIAACRVAFRVLPRFIEASITRDIIGVVDVVGIWLLLKTFFRGIGLLPASIVQVAAGTMNNVELSSAIEKAIRDTLGIHANEFELYPIRKMVNDEIKEKKKRARLESRPTKKVHTRIYKDTKYSGTGGDF